MNCPTCRTELTPRTDNGITVDLCHSCQGSFYEIGELRDAKDATLKDGNWLDFEMWKEGEDHHARPSDRHCPSCDKQMVTVVYGHTGVEVEYCKSCNGFWLDKDEFSKIVEKLDEEINTKNLSGYVASSVKELKDLFAGPEGFVREYKDLTTVLHLLGLKLFVQAPAIVHQKIADVYNALPGALK